MLVVNQEGSSVRLAVASISDGDSTGQQQSAPRHRVAGREAAREQPQTALHAALPGLDAEAPRLAREMLGEDVAVLGPEMSRE